MSASSGAIRAGRAFIELFTEDSAVGRGLRATSAKMAAWGASVNKLGGFLGDGVGQAFKGIAKGAKLAGFAIAGLGAGLLGAASLFAEADRATMTDAQAKAADAMKASFAALKDGAAALNNVLMGSLQPGVSAVIDIVRVGMNAFRGWLDAHQELIQGVNDFLGGLRDALSAGDVELAVEILWAGLKTTWAAGVAWVMEATLGWKTSLQQTMSEAFLGLQQIATNVWNAIADAGQSAADWMVDAFQAAVAGIARAFAYVGEKIGLLEKGTAEILSKDQSRSREQRQAARTDRDKEAAKQRAKAEEDFGQTVIDANKAIADANRRAIDDAKADFEKKKEALADLQSKAKENAQPIEAGLAQAKAAIDERSTSAFGGGRAQFQAATDVAGKSIADSTRETAKNTRVIAAKIGNLETGLAVT